jgi:hypothetical protein
LEEIFFKEMKFSESSASFQRFKVDFLRRKYRRRKFGLKCRFRTSTALYIRGTELRPVFIISRRADLPPPGGKLIPGAKLACRGDRCTPGTWFLNQELGSLWMELAFRGELWSLGVKLAPGGQLCPLGVKLAPMGKYPFLIPPFF